MIINNLEALSNSQAALFAHRVFKTGPGEYAEGDLFRGIRVPVLRKMVPSLDGAPLPEVILLLESASHELLHKATGWMLREVGKRDLPTLESFLQRHSFTMPRVMLRYAIERFPEKLRLRYLRGFGVSGGGKVMPL